MTYVLDVQKEKTFAAEQSARVIDAYRTLNKPLSRALYLVSIFLALVSLFGILSATCLVIAS